MDFRIRARFRQCVIHEYPIRDALLPLRVKRVVKYMEEVRI